MIDIQHGSKSKLYRAQQALQRHGLPDQLVSDNGPQFTSNEFSQFMRLNGIKPSLVAPCSNGQAERFVQTFKQYFKAEDARNIQQNLALFLFSYRTTPNSTTGHTPAELFLNRCPKTRLDFLKPDLGRKIETKPNDQKVTQDAHSKDRNFQVNKTVLVQNSRGEPKWLEAVIIERTGPVSYTVQIGEEIAKRHVDQILSKKDSGKSKRVIDNTDCSEDYMVSLGSNQVSSEATNNNDGLPCRTPSINNTSTNQPRYPTRVRQPPNRLTY